MQGGYSPPWPPPWKPRSIASGPQRRHAWEESCSTAACSAPTPATGLVTGHWTGFRRIVAEMDRPDLFAARGMRPLAMTSLVRGPEAETGAVAAGFAAAFPPACRTGGRCSGSRRAATCMRRGWRPTGSILTG